MKRDVVVRAAWIAGAVALSLSTAAFAEDIQGVLPAAIDQPRIHVQLATSPGGTPLNGLDEFGDPTTDIPGYLDTGSSGISVAQDAVADPTSFNLPNSTYNGNTVVFSDVGIGGSQDFYVSSPYYLSMAPFNGNNDLELGGTPPDAAEYTTQAGPVAMQIDPTPTDPDLGPLNIFGMPVMQNKVAVMDMRTANQLDDISTYLYDAGTPFKPDTLDTDPGIVPVQFHIKTGYANFDRFTQINPSQAPGPNQNDNPFIGPNPLQQLPDGPAPTANEPPPVSLSFGGHTATGSFLFDTGAVTSFISQGIAALLHVHYAPGTYNTDNPELVDDNGDPIPGQFIFPLGGIGGSVNAAGFYLDSLTLQTMEGEPLNFLDAPIVVTDVSVYDPVANESLTLDGDLGMNFFTASVDLDTFNINSGAFDWVTFDQANGTIGVDLVGADLPVPEPAGAAMLLFATPLLLWRRRPQHA